MAQGGGPATQALTRGLQGALGEELVSLILYGSAARGTDVPGRSDVNVLLVLRDASAAMLHRASPALAAWAQAGHTPPLIQTEADWAASADVFPIEIEEIREAHTVLAGRDVLSALRTSGADQRRELEREARGKLIRLRAAYAVAAGDGAQLAGLLVNALGTFLVLFRAALRIAGAPAPAADPTGLVRATAAAAGFAAEPFEWALTARRAPKTPALKAFDPLAASYLAAVERFVKYVDGLKTGDW